MSVYRDWKKRCGWKRKLVWGVLSVEENDVCVNHVPAFQSWPQLHRVGLGDSRFRPSITSPVYIPTPPPLIKRTSLFPPFSTHHSHTPCALTFCPSCPWRWFGSRPGAHRRRWWRAASSVWCSPASLSPDTSGFWLHTREPPPETRFTGSCRGGSRASLVKYSVHCQVSFVLPKNRKDNISRSQAPVNKILDAPLWWWQP